MGGSPSRMTVRSNATIRSKLIIPTCCIELITAVQRMAVPSASPCAAAAAAFAAAVWLAIICCALAIRAWSSAIRWPAGGMLASISRPIFCRSRMFLNIPMSGRPVEKVETLGNCGIRLDPVVPADVGGLPRTGVDALGRGDLDELGGVVVVRGNALADRGELLKRNAGDRLEVRASRRGTRGVETAALLLLVRGHPSLRGGLLRGGHLLR